MVLLKILIVLSTFAVLSVLITHLHQKRSLKTQGTGALVYGTDLKVVSLILIAGFLWGGYVVNFAAPNRLVRSLLLVIFMLFTLLCFALLLESLFVRVHYNVWGLFTFSPWRPSREVPWHTVTSVKWYEHYEWYVLETRGFGKVRLSSYLYGLPEFFGVLEGKRPDLVKTLKEEHPDLFEENKPD